MPAVAQMTKMSTLFIFDRVTGEPLFGLEERPVPQSDVPGEATWPTQPFPLQPPPLARTTFDPAKDIYTLTPEHAAYCRDLWDTQQDVHEGHLHAARARRHDGDVSRARSAAATGAGLSYDPRRGLVFTNIMNLGQVARMERRTDAEDEGRGDLPPHLAVGTGRRTVLEPRDQGAVLGAAVRRAGRGRREPRVRRLARAARRVRRSEGARIRRYRHAEHRRHDCAPPTA